MEEKKDLNLASLKVDQLSYVFKDVQKQAKIMEAIFKTPRFRFIDVIDGIIRYRGNKTKISIKLGAVRYLNTQIELIQWLEGDCAYKEFLEKGREGLHHIGFLVEDYQAYLDYFKEKEIGLLQYGRDITRWAYLDTEKSFGIIIELIEVNKLVYNYFFNK